MRTALITVLAFFTLLVTTPTTASISTTETEPSSKQTPTTTTTATIGQQTLTEWQIEFVNYIHSLQDETCKHKLLSIPASNEQKTKSEACQLLNMTKSAFITLTNCSEDVYNRMEQTMCDGGSTQPKLPTVQPPPSGGWKKELHDYLQNLDEGTCKQILVPQIMANKDQTKPEVCKSLKAKKALFPSIKCSDDVYNRMEQIFCVNQPKENWEHRFKNYVHELDDGTCKSNLLTEIPKFMQQSKTINPCALIKAAKSVFQRATKCSMHKYSRVEQAICGEALSPIPAPSTPDWKVELAKYVPTIQDPTCKANLLKSLQKPDSNKKQKDACKYLRSTKTVFETTTKCTNNVYNDMEKITCGGNGRTVPKAVATKQNWHYDITKYIYGLSSSYCRSSLIAEVRMFLEKKETVDPCIYIKENHPQFTKSTRCSEDIYHHMENILCIRPEVPKNDTSPRQWKSRLTKYVGNLAEGICKTSMDVYLVTLTDDSDEVHPCKFIKFTEPSLERTTNCSREIYNDLREVMCRGTSLTLSSCLLALVCVVRYLLVL